nr:unnamed protein product [Spirometra erinaceieuropaei]
MQQRRQDDCIARLQFDAQTETVKITNCGLKTTGALDLSGLASRPSVLRLPQPLLHNATTTVEGCLVVVGGAGDVDFVQAVLLGEQVAGGGAIVVIKPVLMLATCVTEDSQGRRLDCVPQLTPLISTKTSSSMASATAATGRLSSR